MQAAITKITARTLIVLGVLAVALAANYVRSLPPGITFATNGVELKIDSKAWYNGSKVASATWHLKNLVPGSDKFWQFDDIKPGDWGCNVISMHVKNTDAWMCLDFKNLEESENGENEPEGAEDATTGADLADGMEFFGWVDDGDGTYEPNKNEKPLFGTSTQAASSVLNDKTYVIGDSKYGSSCKANTTKYVGICWCAGDLVVLPNGKTKCDATTLGNAAQTDSFSVDVEIRAEPSRDKPKFVCGGAPPVPPPPPHCNGSCGHSGPISIIIENNAVVISNTSSSANTGGNSAHSTGSGQAGPGGSVTTGSASATSSSIHIINRIRERGR
jgi:hypothetical protein